MRPFQRHAYRRPCVHGEETITNGYFERRIFAGVPASFGLSVNIGVE